jgi:phosphatidylglycerophosphate synthase
LPALSIFVVSLLPNLLTLARLLLGLCFPLLPPEWWLPAVIVAALSDMADGYLSRSLHAVSNTGRYLDPIADKVFVVFAAVTLLIHDRLMLLELLLVGLRDVTVTAGAIWLLLRGDRAALQRMKPTILGKVATFAQFGFLLTLLIMPEWKSFALWPTAALSGLAAIDYLRWYWHCARGADSSA